MAYHSDSLTVPINHIFVVRVRRCQPHQQPPQRRLRCLVRLFRVPGVSTHATTLKRKHLLLLALFAQRIHALRWVTDDSPRRRYIVGSWGSYRPSLWQCCSYLFGLKSPEEKDKVDDERSGPSIFYYAEPLVSSHPIPTPSLLPNAPGYRASTPSCAHTGTALRATSGLWRGGSILPSPGFCFGC